MGVVGDLHIGPQTALVDPSSMAPPLSRGEASLLFFKVGWNHNKQKWFQNSMLWMLTGDSKEQKGDDQVILCPEE